MSIPVSTVPAAIAALTTLVTTQTAADPTILVCQGEVGMDTPNDIIQIATDVRRTVVPEAFLGSYQAGALQETYTITCLVSAWSGDPDAVAITSRAYVLAGYIETAVRTDPSLGSTILEAHPGGTSGGNATWTESPVGRLCELSVTIDVLTIN